MKTLIEVLLIIALFFGAYLLLLYTVIALCYVASRADRRAERMEFKPEREKLKFIKQPPTKPKLPHPPKYLSNYKSIIMHHIRRLDKLYSPGHRLKAFEEVVT